MSAEGDSTHPHKPLQAQRRHFHPPATNTPSRARHPLRQIRPPERLERPATGSSKRRWRVFFRLSPHRRVVPVREGVFVRGGRFCTPPQATTDTTPTGPPSRDIFTLRSGLWNRRLGRFGTAEGARERGRSGSERRVREWGEGEAAVWRRSDEARRSGRRRGEASGGDIRAKDAAGLLDTVRNQDGENFSNFTQSWRTFVE